ncbi:MAG TPA: SDR family NAD(P)-dependent oxidoreductase, partial [Myxococcota bacterium]|nr:SDR family NAD(P)-dependent oxidoreductase [Myxococcota bacterium]
MPSAPDPRSVYDLTGRVAVVAGAASDIGAAIARALSGVGARVVLGDIDGPRLDDVAKALREEGADASGLVTDV